MATPATLKRMEQSKKKAMERKQRNQASGWVPLSVAQAPRPPISMPVRSVKDSGGYLDFTSDEPIIASATRQYTSFESNPSHRVTAQKKGVDNAHYGRSSYNGRANGRDGTGMKSKKQQASVREVETPPEEVVCDGYAIRPDNLVCFHGKDHYLSSLYPSKLSIDGNEYGSVEQYYQACKLYELVGPQYAIQLRGVRSPMQAKSAARNILRELGVKDADIEAWKERTGVGMLYHATLHKFAQNKPLRQKLLSTENAVLAHAYDRDTYFACGMKKDELARWAVENEGKTLKIPSELMSDIGNYVRYVSLTGKGKNVLGCILMQVRSELKGKTQTGVMGPLENNLSEMSIDKTKRSTAAALSANDVNATTDEPITTATEEKSGEEEDEEQTKKEVSGEDD